jgi:protein phosphatase
MPVVYTLLGVQGSGKSTWARANAARLNAVVLSSDEIRNELEVLGRPDEARNGARVFEIFNRRLGQLLAEGKNVISDATHARQSWRADELAVARRLKAEVVGVMFDVPVQVCRDRNDARPRTGRWGERYVPDDFLCKVARDFEPPQPGEVDHVWDVRT